ncbi:MAG TPA: hypothetical protein VLA44_02540 [Clostridia bacterium]|nr:hypothetical protein [Clostridia bacterium]
MASILARQLLARATGQASRRGLILRQPSGERLLADVEAWLLSEYPDMVRWSTLRPTGEDQAQLAVSLHPAAPELRLTAWDSGRVDAIAETVAAGPGYHRFVGRVLERLGLELSIGWARDDPLDVTFGERPMVEQAYLSWLGPRLVKARKAAEAGRPAPQLGLPEGTRYTFDGAIATALGPRDLAWLDAAIANPRVAVDVTPWWADATDARYLLNRALCLMWLDVRWRAPAVEGEARLLDEIHGLLTHAFPLEPGLPYPWHAWREIARVRGIDDQMARQVAERAAATPEPMTPVGYRRAPVTLRHAGWVIDVPGSFADIRTEDELWVGGAGRSITLAATETGTPAGPMSAQEFLDQVAGTLGTGALTHRNGPILGRARVMTDTSSGVEFGVVEGFMAVRGSGAVVRITFDDPEDWHWALDAWRALTPG